MDPGASRPLPARNSETSQVASWLGLRAVPLIVQDRYAVRQGLGDAVNASELLDEPIAWSWNYSHIRIEDRESLANFVNGAGFILLDAWVAKMGYDHCHRGRVAHLEQVEKSAIQVRAIGIVILDCRQVLPAGFLV